ncbi:AAA family ATPase [Planctomycetaceae bacterium SCGC AG-212-F19]|nr:AAA family ATPase [Planctomycetaceae bacterium SCGC AG-212-F19]
MKLTDQLNDYVNAAFSGLWVVSSEIDEAEREIIQHAKQQQWKVAVWDVANGLRLAGSTNGSRPDTGAGDPLAALRALPALSDPKGTALLLLHNFHRFLSSPDVVQTTFSQLIQGKQQRTFVVVLSPVVQVPVELEKLFVVIDHQLPDREQLSRIATELTSDQPNDLPTGNDLQPVLDAAAGLTRYEAEGAFALSLTRHNARQPQCIWELKAQTLKKNNLLTLHRGNERFESLGGLANVKDFCRRALLPGKTVKAKGVLLLGVPGTGKSALAKALGNETGRPTLILDVGSLYGSLVGATEANVRQALKIADAMAPCVLFTDELEKGLSGVGGQGDSGVSTRLFGTLLTWLAEHESDVFFIGTANDISKLPPEFTRAERLDGVFFIDLPTVEERYTIWHQYMQLYGIAEFSDDNWKTPKDDQWTGAEIKSCCRLAALLGVPLSEAAKHVVPVAVTANEQVEKLRGWASGRCLSASSPGVYSRDGEQPVRGRRVNGGPANN